MRFVTLVDWLAWHTAYDDIAPSQTVRLSAVQDLIRDALDNQAPGPVRLLSLRAGEGHDVIGVLADHPRRREVDAHLYEQAEVKVRRMRAVLDGDGLDGVTIHRSSAGLEATAASAPADVVVVSDVCCDASGRPRGLVSNVHGLAALCRPGATVIWTQRCSGASSGARVRAAFAMGGFSETEFHQHPGLLVGSHAYKVGLNNCLGWPEEPEGQRLAVTRLQDRQTTR